MKGRKSKQREHRVPLFELAIALLKSMMPPAGEKPSSGIVFPSPIEGEEGSEKPGARPLSDVALSKALRLAGGGEAAVHGTARSTFRDWAADMLSPHEIRAAAKIAIQENGTLTDDDMANAISRLPGFKRTGPELRIAILKAVQS